MAKKKTFETGLVYDQPQPAPVCPPMDSSVVSYTGRIDAGAAHRALAAARALLIAGVWNGKDAIAIHNPYELENKLMRLEWDHKTASALVAGVDYDIYMKPTFETGRLYDQPQPSTPLTDPEGFERKLVHTEEGTPYLTLVRKPALAGEILPEKLDTWFEQIARGLFALVTETPVSVANTELPTFGDIEDIEFRHVCTHETGMLYDQPQPFTFKRGEVVEFKIHTARSAWVKGVFYNIYPGDKRLACIRREGVYEGAFLADIRRPVAVDIFNGMGDFRPSSAKAA